MTGTNPGAVLDIMVGNNVYMGWTEENGKDEAEDGMVFKQWQDITSVG